MAPAFPQRLSARQSFHLIIFIFWLLFLSLISQTDTLHWKLKAEEMREVHWFTVLLDFDWKQRWAVALCVKSPIFHLWRFQIWTWCIIFPNSVRLCDCSYRASRGRGEAIARKGILSRGNQVIVFPSLLAVHLKMKERRKEERKKGRVGKRRKEKRGIAVS